MSTSRRGLSLIEVVVVMTLITVMMALSLPMMSNANAKARAELCQQNLIEMSQTIVGYTLDMNELPTLYALEPTQPGLSLPEFIEPRVHTPHVVFCPSDETEKSQLLGTSYHWSSRFNGLEPERFDELLGQSMLKDREAFHTGSAMPANELLLMRAPEGHEGYELSLLGEKPRDKKANGNRPDLNLGRPGNAPDHSNAPGWSGPPGH